MDEAVTEVEDSGCVVAEATEAGSTKVNLASKTTRQGFSA